MRSTASLTRFGASSAWLAVAVAAAVTAARFPPGNGVVPGPGMFPLILSGLLGVLAIVQAGVSLRKPEVASLAPEAGPAPWRVRLGLLASMAVYTVLMPRLGFITTSTLLVIVVLRLLGFRQGARAAAMGLIAGFVLYGFFAGVMGVPLPEGWLG